MATKEGDQPRPATGMAAGGAPAEHPPLLCGCRRSWVPRDLPEQAAGRRWREARHEEDIGCRSAPGDTDADPKSSEVGTAPVVLALWLGAGLQSWSVRSEGRPLTWRPAFHTPAMWAGLARMVMSASGSPSTMMRSAS